MAAYNEALQVLSWYEHLQKDEIPPRNTWWSGDQLDEWFEEVLERRQKPASKRSSYDSADDAPMMGNELVNRSRIKSGADDGGRQVPI